MTDDHLIAEPKDPHGESNSQAINLCNHVADVAGVKINR